MSKFGKEYYQKYRAANRESMRAADRRYREKDKNAFRAKDRAKKRKWRLENPDRDKENHRAWREANPLKMRKYWARWRLRSLALSEEQLATIRRQQKNKCGYCRCLLSHKMHLDHIVPLARGGTNDISNLQFLCAPCNQMKGARDPLEFARAEFGLLL